MNKSRGIHIVREISGSAVYRGNSIMMKQSISCVLLGLAAQILLVSAGRPDFITDDMMDMVADDKNRCMGLHGTSQALIDEVNTGVMANDRSLTCYMDCLLSAFGVIDEGELDVDMLVGFLPDNLQGPGGEVLNACANSAGTDSCDKIYQIGKCVQAKRPDLWFMI